ncbi:hypothetical protein AAG570_011526 [Ranatra chinensis]|uniref:Peroxisomal biogenesis factor 3 n=1 Tax=Ranatra chinensis TaxID=642074 RepID=A0ABD0YKW5_9HEMI
MFSKMRQFFYRHRRKFIVGGIVIGGAVFLVRYAGRKFVEWNEKEVKELLQKSRKQHHFQSTESTCNQMIISMSSILKDEVLSVVNTEELLTKLKSCDGDRLCTWEELKVSSFTQYTALMYSGIILVVLLRVQLNIIGGYTCHGLSETNNGIASDSTLQGDYLSLSQCLVSSGVKDICKIIKKHVTDILKDVSLKKMMSLKDIEQFFWSVQERVSNDPDDPLKNLSRFLSNANSARFQTKDIAKLYKILSETVEVLQTEEIISLVSSCLTQGFSQAVDRIADCFIPKRTGKTQEDPDSLTDCYTNINSIKLPMAKVVPIIYGLSKGNLVNEEPELWIQSFISMDKLLAFGANLYEAFSYSGQ